MNIIAPCLQHRFRIEFFSNQKVDLSQFVSNANIDFNQKELKVQIYQSNFSKM